MRKNKTHIKRFQRNLTPKKVILIVCEGEKTEKNYFNQLKNFLNMSNVNVSIVPSPHSSPSLVVKYAKQKSNEINEYDEIYCVFDRDTHTDFDDALQKANNIKKALNKQNLVFETIVSDPCFEFWILLHFAKITPSLNTNQSPRNALQNHKDFKKNLPNYSKDYDFRELIEKPLQVAIKNSKQVNKENLQVRQSPYTQVVELVERLQGLVKCGIYDIKN